MLAIPCPTCGPRPRLEFAYTGEAGRTSPEAGVNIRQWRTYLYFHANDPGWTREYWLHVAGCGRIVLVERHRSTNEIRQLDAASGVVS